MSNTQEIISLELWDIFDHVYYDKERIMKTDINKLLISNMKEILRREKLWHRGFAIYIDKGCIDMNEYSTGGSYSYDFNIYEKNGSCIGAGCIYGDGTLDKDEDDGSWCFTIVDMMLELLEYNMPRLKQKFQKEVVVFC